MDTPPEREGRDLDGKMVTGVWPTDYTYYKDFWNGEYVTICKKTHDELLAPKLAPIKEKGLGL